MRLGINYREKKKKTTTVKNTNTWRLKSMPLNNQGSLKKSKRKWKTANLETNGYENKTIHNLWDMEIGLEKEEQAKQTISRRELMLEGRRE